MTLSESVSKKRGRPKVFEDWELEHAKSFCNATTQRGIQNWLYSQRAISELIINRTEKPYEFLPTEADVMQRKATLPMLLLTELGRLQPDEMHHLASEICRRGLSDRDATKFVKQVRSGRDKGNFDRHELAKAIAKVIDQYCEKHRFTYGQVASSLNVVLETISKIQEAGE